MLRLVQLLPLVFLILLLAIGALVIGGLLYNVFKRRPRSQPQPQPLPELTSAAAVVAKRELHSSSLQSPALSQYYVTFQFPSRGRMEFPVPARDYGLLAEGDVGRLTFRGEQYIRFEREL